MKKIIAHYEKEEISTKEDEKKTLEHKIEITENEIIFTAEYKMKINATETKMELLQMIEKQQSPIHTILEEIEEERREDIEEEKYKEPLYKMNSEIKRIMKS